MRLGQTLQHQRDSGELLPESVVDIAGEPQPLDDLRASLQMDEESFSKAIEKLYTHGGAEVDFNNNATRGPNEWVAPYTRQSDYKRKQMALVQRFVEGHQCRMAALVLHFGDLADGKIRCGLCDFCNPQDSSAQQHRPASRKELETLAAILNALRNTTGKSLGRLLKELPGDLSRRELDTFLDALAKADLLTVEDAEWIKDGETILFRKACLTETGAQADSGDLSGIRMPETAADRKSAQLSLKKQAAFPQKAEQAKIGRQSSSQTPGFNSARRIVRPRRRASDGAEGMAHHRREKTRHASLRRSA